MTRMEDPHFDVTESRDMSVNIAQPSIVPAQRRPQRMTTSTRYKLLLIEDDPDLAEKVMRQASGVEAGMRGIVFDITWVSYVSDASAMLVGGGFDVALLDWEAADCEGLTSIERLQAIDADAAIVVLAEGAYDSEPAFLAAHHHGAEDFLSKSDLEPENLIRSLLYAIECGKRRSLRRRLDAKERELAAASTLQQMLLPKSAPAIAGLKIAGRYWPFDNVGGDYFDYLEMNEEALGLVIADVSGHSLASALVMTDVRRVVRTCFNLYDDVGEILSIANRTVHEDNQRFVTAFLGHLNVANRELTYASAAHPSFVVASSGKVTRLESGNLPLGVAGTDEKMTVSSVKLQVGDLLVLMTDGFYEVRNDADRQWGIDGVLASVHQLRQHSPERIINECHSRALSHACSNEIIDDMAMIIAKVC